MRTYYNGLKLAALYTSIVLGAGFASGQELLQYFVGYGTSGIWGLLVSGLIFALTGWAVLDICRKERLRNYKELMAYLMGRRLGFVSELAVGAFLFVLFAAMLSAGGAMLEQSAGIPFSVGVLAVALVTIAVLWFGLDGLIKVNLILAPLMVAGGIFIGIYTFFNQTAAALFQSIVIPGWIVAAMVYASYNMVTSFSVLASATSIQTAVKPFLDIIPLSGIPSTASILSFL